MRRAHLSGGEQQILAIRARTLREASTAVARLSRPKGSSRRSSTKSPRPWRELATAGNMTIILVEQDLEFVAGLASRALIIQKGLIVSEVPPAKLHSAMEIDEIAGIQL